MAPTPNVGGWTGNKAMTASRVVCAAAIALCLIGGALALRPWKHAPQPSREVARGSTAANAPADRDTADSLDWGPTDAPEQFKSLPEGDLKRVVTRQLLEKIAETNPIAAAQMALDLPDALNRPLLSAVLAVWVNKDPLNAVRWVKALPESPMKEVALLSLASAWAAADPVSAADYAILMSEPPSQLLRLAAARWAKQDPASAISWADRLPAGEARDHFLSGLSDGLVEQSPAEAAGLIAAMQAGPAQAEAAVTVVIDWMRSDSKSAAAWLVNFPSGPLREKAVQESLGVLAEHNPAAAQTLLEALAPGSERDQAARRFLSLVQDSNPAAGAKALTAIADPALLREETERLAQHWLMVDAPAARAWLVTVALPEETKANLLAAHGL